MEHRWARRIALKAPVRLALASGELLLGEMMDVSASGAFVQTPYRLPLWVQLEVEVLLRNQHVGAHAERVPAHVTRRASDGAGIEWRDLAPRPVRILLEAVQAAAGAAPDS